MIQAKIFPVTQAPVWVILVTFVVLRMGLVQVNLQSQPFLSPLMESAHTRTSKEKKIKALELENLNVYVYKGEVSWDFEFDGFTFLMFENWLWVVGKEEKLLFFDGSELLF